MSKLANKALPDGTIATKQRNLSLTIDKTNRNTRYNPYGESSHFETMRNPMMSPS